jgi:uncharacterized membrane protein YdjX (TVP38/TMEM64 family)
MFPNTVLNAATVVGLGGLAGPLCALGGSMLSATVFYLVGRRLPEPKRSTRRGAWMLRVMDRVRDTLKDGRIASVIAMRLLPLAPFGVVNLAAGAVRVPIHAYLIGSFLAICPGIAAVTLIGHSLRDVLDTPEPATIAAACGAVVIVAVGAVLLRRRLLRASPTASAKRTRRTSDDRSPARWHGTPPATAPSRQSPSA